jgi:exportin-T
LLVLLHLGLELILNVYQVASAIDIAWNPSSDQNLKRHAIEYLNQFRDGSTGWQVCLAIFVKEPRYSEIVRHVSLEVVNNAVQSGSATNDLATLAKSLMQYVRQNYGSEARDDRVDSSSIQNKISQTITYLFSALYGSGWTSFFDDILSLTSKTSPAGPRDNPYGVILYLRILISIHDEIGDIMLSRSAEEQTKANNLKDLIRQRDAQKIALSWQEILGQWRSGNDTIVEFCLKVIGNYVSWVDISLVVNESMLDLLYQQLSKAQEADLQSGQEKVRDAAIDVFTEIVAKKMKAGDKVQLISFLNLENVVSQLAASTPLQERRFTSKYDTDLAESVAKLVNITAMDIVKVLEDQTTDAQVRQQADAHLQSFLPLVLRFFSDEYDEICSTVIPSVGDLVSFLRKVVKSSGSLPSQYTPMLMPILKAIIDKMKYDETSTWGDEEDQTDEAEFQDLRKRLASLQQSIAEIDEELYVNMITEVVGTTFENLQRIGNQLDWRDLDLALHEMFLFGDLAVKQGGLYKKEKPNSPAAERLVEMMSRLVASGRTPAPYWGGSGEG